MLGFARDVGVFDRAGEAWLNNRDFVADLGPVCSLAISPLASKSAERGGGDGRTNSGSLLISATFSESTSAVTILRSRRLLVESGSSSMVVEEAKHVCSGEGSAGGGAAVSEPKSQVRCSLRLCLVIGDDHLCLPEAFDGTREKRRWPIDVSSSVSWRREARDARQKHFPLPRSRPHCKVGFNAMTPMGL